MAAKVFISYRRADSAGYSGRVMDRLDRELGRDLVFMDVDAIPLGTNFSKVLHQEVAKCGVLLAVIGPNWLDARDEHGNRRLDNPNDFVRIEIAAALQRSIPVIPLLLDGARIPKADELPEDLKELALRNGMEIRHASFQDDMNRLIRGLKEDGVYLAGGDTSEFPTRFSVGLGVDWSLWRRDFGWFLSISSLLGNLQKRNPQSRRLPACRQTVVALPLAAV